MTSKNLPFIFLLVLITTTALRGGPVISFGDVEISTDMSMDEIAEKLAEQFDVKDESNYTSDDGMGDNRFLSFKHSEMGWGSVTAFGPKGSGVTWIQKNYVFTNDFASAYKAFHRVVQEASEKTGETVHIGGKEYEQVKPPEHILNTRRRGSTHSTYNLSMIKLRKSDGRDENNPTLVFTVDLDHALSVSLLLHTSKRSDGSLNHRFDVTESLFRPATDSSVGRW